MKILKMVRFPFLNYVYRMLVMRNASRMYAQVSYGWLYVEELGCLFLVVFVTGLEISSQCFLVDNVYYNVGQ